MNKTTIGALFLFFAIIQIIYAVKISSLYKKKNHQNSTEITKKINKLNNQSRYLQVAIMGALLIYLFF